jgi:hypothetical protein
VKKILKIQLSAPSPDLVHSFRNFGEDVYRALSRECEVSLAEIDASTSTFHIREIPVRFVQEATTKIKKVAAKHALSDQIMVTKV